MSLKAFLQRLAQTRQRALIWVQGDAGSIRRRVEQDVLPLLRGSGVLIGDTALSDMEPVSARQSHRYLGSTLDYLLFDARAGFNPNAFGQLCGTLQGGGVLVLMTPCADAWADYIDPEYASLCVEPYRPEQLQGHFLAWLVSILQQSEQLVVMDEIGTSLPRDWPTAAETVPGATPCLTRDQAMAVEAILKAARRRRRPLVLTADRGRGKSAALGIAAAELLLQGRHVLVTAPDREAVVALEQQVGLLAPDQAGHLLFRRPDALLHARVTADVLLVDEAAAIPTPVLLRLLALYPRIVFATTLHGYEGNGQGFALRFLKHLQQQGQGYDSLHMVDPIRWQGPDPLETLSYRMLMLDADPVLPVSDALMTLERLDRADLVQQPTLLRNLFGLLVLAHYRTTPGDLRILLDSPNIDVYALLQAGQPLACALIAREGPLAEPLAEAVWSGSRRPRGHLLPQTLVAQEGWREAGDWQAWRIARIAVHPGLQQRGYGQQLLSGIEQQARLQHVDYLGASFASEPGLIRFWQHCGYWPVRLGEQRDPVAGSHALLVLRPLTRRVQEWFVEARDWYRQSVLLRLPVALQDLEAEYIPVLLRGTLDATAPIRLSPGQLERLRGFACGQRTLEASLLPLTALLQLSLHRWPEPGLSVSDQQLLCDRILRQRSADMIAEPAGKKAQLQRLRQLCACLLTLVDAE